MRRHRAVSLCNNGESDFPCLKAAISLGGRTTLEGQFANNFRSRVQPLDDVFSAELTRVYSEKRNAAPTSAIARHYTEALPWLPPVCESDREGQYARLLIEAHAARSGSISGHATRCKGRSQNRVPDHLSDCLDKRRRSRLINPWRPLPGIRSSIDGATPQCICGSRGILQSSMRRSLRRSTR